MNCSHRIFLLLVYTAIELGVCRATGESFYVADDFFIRHYSDLTTYTPFAKVPSGGSFGMDGLVVALDGSLYATDSQNGTILRYTAPNSYTVFASGLERPQGLAFDSAGNLFVVENGASYVSRVLKFSAPNAFSVFATGLQSAYGIAIDRTGVVYVSEYGGGNIRRYTAPETSSIYASGLSPTSLALDDGNALYVADYNEDAIRRFAAANSSTVVGNTRGFPMSVGVQAGGDVLAGDFLGDLHEFPSGGGSTLVMTGLGKVLAIAIVPEPGSTMFLLIGFGLLYSQRLRMRRQKELVEPRRPSRDRHDRVLRPRARQIPRSDPGAAVR